MMKIYKWISQDPIKCMALAIASSEEEARRLCAAEFDLDMGEDPTWFAELAPEVIPLDTARAVGVVWNG